MTRKTNFLGINTYDSKIIFLENLGNLPLLKVQSNLIYDEGTSVATVFVSENSPGLLPEMNGPQYDIIEMNVTNTHNSKVSHIIDGLKTGNRYHFRISSWNGIGLKYGRTQYSTPAISKPISHPAE